MLNSTRSYADFNSSRWHGRSPGSSALGAISAAIAAATAAAALADAAWSNSDPADGLSGRQALASASRPSPLPLLLRDVNPRDALAINLAIPLSAEPNPAARSFKFSGDAVDYLRALECLASAVYYEAGSEPAHGQRAVAQVVLNRVRHPAFPASVCGVVYEGSTRRTGCQFTFTCDGSLQRRPSLLGWRQAAAVAKAALDGEVFAPVGYATHYHANYVVPYWATSLAKNAVHGSHIFYRWPAWWGQPAAFARSYRGREPDPRELRFGALRQRRYGEPLDPLAGQELSLEIDPRVELAGIVDLLARGSPNGELEPKYHRRVRGHFSNYSEHLAVQIYRQLAGEGGKLNMPALAGIMMHYSPPPKLEARGRLEHRLVVAAGGKEKLDGLIAALREFALHSNFEKFWQEQQPIYAELAAQVQARPAVLQSAYARAAAIPLEIPKFILAPLLKDAVVTGCRPISKRASEPWVMIAAEGQTRDSGRRTSTAGQDLVRCEGMEG